MIALGDRATGAVASIQALDGANLEAGVGTFLAVSITVPALAVLAASVGGGRDTDDAVALAGGLALAGVALALLSYACSGSGLLLTLFFALLAWLVFPAVAGLVEERTGRTAPRGAGGESEEGKPDRVSEGVS